MGTQKSFGLGKGLSAIIPDRSTPEPSKNKPPEKDKSKKDQWVQDVSTASVLPNPNQPRKTLDAESLESLSNSLKEYGLLQPIVVKELGNEKYELIAGQRRLAAAKLAGIVKIPAIIKRAKAGRSLAMSLIENLQRQDLNPIDEAKAYKQLLEEFFFTKDDVAKMAGRNRSTILNYLDLLALTDDVQELIKGRQLTLAHAKVLLQLKAPDRQKALAHRIIRDELSATHAQSILDGSDQSTGKKVKVLNSGKEIEIPDKKENSLGFKEAQEDLESILGTKVQVEKKGRVGKVIIEFYSEEDLDNLLGRFVR